MHHLSAAAVSFCLMSTVALADDLNIIVGFHGEADRAIFSRHGGAATTDLSALQAVAGHVPPGRLKALRSESGVAYVEEDLIRHTTGDFIPNDPYFGPNQSKELGLINAPASRLAGVVASGVRQVVNVVKAYSEKEESPAAPAAA